jgi:hypothetical protein
VRAEHPLPPLSGSTDIYSVGQSVPLAWGLPWSPRPLLQSYTAYTPDLAMDDAHHLGGAAAPDNVLLRLQPIDNRYPSLEDGPSWLGFIRDYGLLKFFGVTALLRKLPEKPSYALLGQRTRLSSHMLNEPVDIPKDQPALWAWINVTPTTLGRLATAVFKPPPLGLTLKMADGQIRSFRFIAGMAQAGFLLTPMVTDAVQLIALKVPDSHGWGDRIPLSFTLTGDTAYWNATFSLMTAPLVVPQSEDQVTRIFLPPQPTQANGDTDSKCNLDAINGTIGDRTKLSQLKGLVRLTGWAYGVAAHGVEPQSISMTFRGSDGNMFAAPAILESRPDVGAYFHQPQLSMVGFEALVDLRQLRGSYLLGTQIMAGGRGWSCNLAEIEVLAH